MGAMPPADRRLLEGLERDAWYPFATFVRLEETIVRLFGGGDDVYEELGAESARARFVWLRQEARLISVHALLSRAAEEHAVYHDFGHAEYRRTGFRQGEVELSDFPETSPVFCRSFCGYLAEVVRQHGAEGPRVEELSCQSRGDRSCVFRIGWVSGVDSGGAP